MISHSAFLCYTHADDELDHGRITQIAEDLEREFEAITVDTLTIGFDHQILGWGHRWRTHLTEAINEATFMICVVTPRFFASAECRAEVERFGQVANDLGRGELLLPLHYIEVADLFTNTDDPLRVRIAQTELRSWLAERFTDRSSSEYRRGINQLAVDLQRRLVELRDPIPRPELSPRSTDTHPVDREIIDELSRLTRSYNETQVEMKNAVARDLDRYGTSDSLPGRLAMTMQPFAGQLERDVKAYRAALDRADQYVSDLLDGRTALTRDEVIRDARQIVANYEHTRDLADTLEVMVALLGQMGTKAAALRPVTRRLQAAVQSFADSAVTNAVWADDANALLASLGV